MASVGDVISLLDLAGVAQAHVVGHDWGAAVAWATALTNPTRVRSLTTISVGHPNAWTAGGDEQLRRSWYMLLFQFEDVAEDLLTRDDWALFRRFVGNHAETGSWIDDLSRPFALTASLNWYRANTRPDQLLSPRALPSALVPTMGIWSAGDRYLTEAQMVASSDHVEAEWRYERIEEASHWVPLDAPDGLTTLLLDWFSVSA
jgi:pimeloyl-ACP methyl ester carboxylesterase